MAFIKPIDKEILYHLDYNSRQSAAELGRTLQLSRERAAYRVSRLVEAGVIRSFTTAINPYKFGLMIHKTYLALDNNRQRISKLIEHLKNHPRVMWHAEASGGWDLMFATYGRNPREFHIIQSDILTKFSDIVVGISVYTIIDAMFFPKNYLRGIGSGSFYFGGQPENHRLSSLELEILKLLSQNSRISITEMAERTNSTPIVVRKRIGKLEDLGIIVGYRIEANPSWFGLYAYKVQLHFRNYDSRGQHELMEYCKAHPNIILVVQQLGDCMVELELEVPSSEALDKIVSEIRERFTKYIRRVDTIRVQAQYHRWMPPDLRADESLGAD